MIDPQTLRQLCSAQGREAIAAVHAAMQPTSDFLSLYQRLEKRFPRQLTRTAIEQVLLRRRAAAKFSQAQDMFFTREALEQASSEPVAENRARRFKDFRLLFDLGCGIGGDTFRLAQYATTVAIDHDRLRLLLLSVNAKALRLSEKVLPVQGDLLDPGWQYPANTGLFMDPSRRTGGGRAKTTDAYRPPLRAMVDQLAEVDALAVKVSPAVDLDEIERLDCEIEFVSLKGELKEATLWFRGLKSAARRATLLPGGHSMDGDSEPDLNVEAPKQYLYEPDPAILRARLVRSLGVMLGASQIDPTIGLLSADEYVDTPFARAYRVQQVMPFSLKTLRAVLRNRGVGKVTLKKRGSGVDVESFLPRLRLRGENEATVLLTRCEGTHVALLIDPLCSP